MDCLPCLARNAIDLARKSAQGDAALEAEIARSGMEILGSAAADGYPPPPLCYARRLIDNALAKSGGRVPDPWAKEKKRSTELALKLMEQMGLYTNGNCHNCSQITTANLDISALSRMLAHPSGSASPNLPSDASHLRRISADPPSSARGDPSAATARLAWSRCLPAPIASVPAASCPSRRRIRSGPVAGTPRPLRAIGTCRFLRGAFRAP